MSCPIWLLYKKKKVIVLYIHAGTCDPLSEIAYLVKVLQTLMGRGFETSVTM